MFSHEIFERPRQPVLLIEDLTVHLSSMGDVAVYWFRSAPIIASGGNSSSYRKVYGMRRGQVKRPSGGVGRVSSHALRSNAFKRKSRNEKKKSVSLHAKTEHMVL